MKRIRLTATTSPPRRLVESVSREEFVVPGSRLRRALRAPSPRRELPRALLDRRRGLVVHPNPLAPKSVRATRRPWCSGPSAPGPFARRGPPDPRPSPEAPHASAPRPRAPPRARAPRAPRTSSVAAVEAPRRASGDVGHLAGGAPWAGLAPAESTSSQHRRRPMRDAAPCRQHGRHRSATPPLPSLGEKHLSSIPWSRGVPVRVGCACERN